MIKKKIHFLWFIGDVLTAQYYQYIHIKYTKIYSSLSVHASSRTYLEFDWFNFFDVKQDANLLKLILISKTSIRMWNAQKQNFYFRLLS